MINAQ